MFLGIPVSNLVLLTLLFIAFGLLYLLKKKESTKERPTHQVPTSSSHHVLQQQETITAPGELTPERARLPSPLPTQGKDIFTAAQRLLLDAGFFPVTYHKLPFVIGPLGEMFFLHPKDGALQLLYAVDFSMAKNGQWEVVKEFSPIRPEILTELQEWIFFYAAMGDALQHTQSTTKE